jgi:fimbrial chaperone protein
MRGCSFRLIAAVIRLFAVLVAIAGQGQAQGLQIAPVMVELPTGQMATTLSITNQNVRSTTIQVRPFRWEQAANADQLTPTDSLAASPPIADIDPHQTQTVRLVLRQPAAGSEASYRLVLDELPSPAAPGTVSVALRISIPVFAEPETRVAPKLSCRIVVSPRGSALVAANQGGRHIRIVRALLTSPLGVTVAVPTSQSPYVLPGAERSWRLPPSTHLQLGTTMHLSATSDVGAVDVSVPVTAEP